jgi:UDP-N-acetyl-2-amino-2-deoxyglucuronate dehydrogenase
VTIEDGVVVVAAVHAIYASAHLGRPVRFEDVISGAYDELQFSVPAHNP